MIRINGGVELELMGRKTQSPPKSVSSPEQGASWTFLERAFHSPERKSFICLASTYKKKDGSLKSNIVPFIPGGNTVSAPREMVLYVAAEYGVAKLSGLSLRERAEAMAATAHPHNKYFFILETLLHFWKIAGIILLRKDDRKSHHT